MVVLIMLIISNIVFTMQTFKELLLYAGSLQNDDSLYVNLSCTRGFSLVLGQSNSSNTLFQCFWGFLVTPFVTVCLHRFNFFGSFS
jgi:hypothetical protein